jgi:hypothetical protein
MGVYSGSEYPKVVRHVAIVLMLVVLKEILTRALRHHFGFLLRTGMDGEDAKKRITADMPGLNVIVLPKVRDLAWK